jgi:hypothetical protein
MSYVSTRMRRRVTNRAGGRCEYCLFPQVAALFSFEMEHIISEKHGGSTEEDNLALSCPFCNGAKGSDIGSLDPETGQLTPFFNPRRNHWQEHFRLEGVEIVPLTAEGRVTVNILQLNHLDRLQERERLLATGRYPG